jgi:hypothetical protein
MENRGFVVNDEQRRTPGKGHTVAGVCRVARHQSGVRVHTTSIGPTARVM